MSCDVGVHEARSSSWAPSPCSASSPKPVDSTRVAVPEAEWTARQAEYQRRIAGVLAVAASFAAVGHTTQHQPRHRPLNRLDER